MSKINKIRFINLNYNYNTMKIDDEKFYLDGENTMLNLRNGGGKSVIVQMIIALFVHRRYRSTKDRAFESFFTSSIPTYILIEWKLDDGAGYLLTGMMVRKKEVTSDENSKEKLDIINFVHEYRGHNEYDINNIPIIEEKNGRKSIKSYVKCKNLFDDLKKNRALKFNYYDMNNSITMKNYFSKLEEYKINYREWETIIKQINIKESGLSELFIKAKDSNGLVKEWFLPAIENKLKNDEDRIDNYRKLLDRYIKQYRQNKSNIDKRSKLELFNELSKNIIICCNEFIAISEKKEEIRNYIANVIFYLKEKLNDEVKEEILLEELIKTLKGKIVDLEYEEESIKIYKKKEEICNLETAIRKQQELVNESEFRRNNLIRKGYILECTRIYRQYQNISKDLQEQEIKLRVLNKENKDNASHINNLGFNIRRILKKEFDSIKIEKINKNKLRCKLVDEKKNINDSIKSNRKQNNKLIEEKGGLVAEIKAFDKTEQTFNRDYSFNLFRNIEGYFDETKVCIIEKEIVEKAISLNKEIKDIKEKILDNKEKLKSRKSEKLKNLERKSDIKNKLNNKNLEIIKVENEIERIKEVIKYIDFSAEKVFDFQNIISSFDRKIDLLKEDEERLKKIFDNTLNELTKLKTGKILEIPKDIEEKLRQKDISITYGMEWLKKNGYSLEKNINIIKDNPFIPYSLIMDSKEIEILEKECLNTFTSSPISIINRRNLEKSFDSINSGIVNLKGVAFYISFNNKLLSENELLKLIDNKEKEVQIVQKNIIKKKDDILFYEERRNSIKYSSLTLEAYEDLKKEIISLKEEDLKLRQIEIDLGKNILSIEDKINIYIEKEQLLEKEIQKNTNKLMKFKEFIEGYKQYKEKRGALKRVIECINVIQIQIDKDESRRSQVEEEIEEYTNIINNFEIKEKKVSKELSEFNIYKSGIVIKKDKEDLIAEYNALTKEIISSEKELRDRINNLSEEFRNVEEELSLKSDKYKIKESEYINEIYDIQKDLKVNDELNKENLNYNNIKNKYNKINKDIYVAKSKLEDLNLNLKKNFNKEVLQDKSLLVDKNFKLEVEKLKLEISEANSKKEQVNKLKVKLDNNLTGLSEFNNLDIIKKIDVKIELNELNNIVAKLKRDLNDIKENKVEKEKNLTNLVVNIKIMDEFKNDNLFKDPIQALITLVGKPNEFKEQLNLITDSYKRIIGKLIADIELIEKEEGKIIESILEYIKEVHENIKKIDDNSSIIIDTKRVKMLTINIHDWEENRELYRIRLKDYIEQIREKSIKALEKNENIEDIISNNINIIKLYDEVIGIRNINIKLYKVEEDRQKQITWDEVSKNSGGEGFLSAFVILTSLLSYMRKDESDVLSRKESGKVLIMDNPFAQTSSAHLLKPLIDIAKKSNTQLICLTGLGGDSIYNRFDNIYVLNLVSSKLSSGIKYLRSEHAKGEEEKEVIVASRFKIEEQINLF